MKTSAHANENMKKRTVRKKHKMTFACDENTCRSPMAKVVLENLMIQKGVQDVEVDSVALERPGSATHARAREAIKERYGDDLLMDHVPKLIDFESLGRLVLVMTRAQEEKLVAKLGKQLGETLVLTVSQMILPTLEPGQRNDFGRDIIDPYDGSLDEYRDCLSKLERYISESQARILKIARGGLYAGCWSRKERPKACPICGSNRVVPLGYGLPTEVGMAEHQWYEMIGRDPPYEFGGCCVGLPGEPNWHCCNCRHEWATEHTVNPKHKKLEA
jgi:protein-tyrosine-phosphatase